MSSLEGSIRGYEAREWLERRRNEELTLTFATIAELAAIVAAVRS
jgi:hypothetical protein